MDDRYFAELAEHSELSRTWLETRDEDGMIRHHSSTDVEPRSAKFRRLSRSASQGSAQYFSKLDEPQKKTGNSKRTRLSESPPAQSQMLQRFLQSTDVPEFIRCVTNNA